ETLNKSNDSITILGLYEANSSKLALVYKQETIHEFDRIGLKLIEDSLWPIS
ncbi:Hypothetical predicted protein, partial [Paramuricea clavata]